MRNSDLTPHARSPTHLSSLAGGMTDLNAFIASTNGQSALSGLPITHLVLLICSETLRMAEMTAATIAEHFEDFLEKKSRIFYENFAVVS